MTPKFRAKVMGGKLSFADAAGMRRWLDGLDGHNVTVVVEKERADRSGSQNRYYWGVVLALIAAETGHSAEELHEVVRREFLPVETIEVGGKSHVVARSTASLTTVEFEKYLEKIRQWASQDLNIFIPLPGEVNY